MFKSIGNKINFTVIVVLVICFAIFFFILDQKTVNDLWSQKLKQARVIYQQLNFLKQWVGQQKGVWIKNYKSPIQQSGKFGRKNTSIILGELSQATVGNKDYKFKVISPIPINEKNRSDTFENQALMKLKMQGGDAEIYKIDYDKKVFRYVKPMLTSKMCISCHPNYTIGNVDGGISIQIPIEDVFIQIKQHRIYLLIFAVITLLIMISIMVFLLRALVVKPIKYLTDKTDKISKGDMNVSAEMNRDDEIGHLAKAVERLRISFKKITDMNK
jgi:methyl-accepting chemotaxis protein